MLLEQQHFMQRQELARQQLAQQQQLRTQQLMQQQQRQKLQQQALLGRQLSARPSVAAANAQHLVMPWTVPTVHSSSVAQLPTPPLLSESAFGRTHEKKPSSEVVSAKNNGAALLDIEPAASTAASRSSPSGEHETKQVSAMAKSLAGTSSAMDGARLASGNVFAHFSLQIPSGSGT